MLIARHGDADHPVQGVRTDAGGWLTGKGREQVRPRRVAAVLVFTHGGVMAFVVPRVSANGRNSLATQRFLPDCVPADVEIDADGWRLDSWPGVMDQVMASEADAEPGAAAEHVAQ